MKKILLIAVALLLLGSILSSCKSHERCPAYSKKIPANTIKQA